MMTRPWKAPQLLMAIMVSLVALTYQERLKTFLSVYEQTVVDPSIQESLKYITDEFNKKSEDLYIFRILRILKVEKQVTSHMEYHISLEMRRTTCLKTENLTTCAFQEGELYKQIQCYFSVYAIPWEQWYKILKKKCSQD